ncbi:MAG: hypothetical protein ACHQ51_12730 [Elusimicrobiota bacterium]
MNRGHFAASLAGFLLLAAGAWAGPPMTSGSNTISRNTADGGGMISASASNQITSAIAEGVAIATTASGSNKIRSGWDAIAFYPGTLTPLTVQNDVTVSSATLNWNTPGLNGALGILPFGSSYIIQVASAGFTGRFANSGTATVTVSTNGVAVGGAVHAGVTSLDPNTTFFVQIWTQDNDGNVAAASPISTITTLAPAPSIGALEFLSVAPSSVVVAWAALPANVSSNSSEGYTLFASSNNFGALAPAGAPVFSSTTYSVLASTLAVGVAGVPLDLSNTYYFQVASLNWTGQPNYTTLAKLNFQISQSATLLHLGTMDPNVARSTVSTSSMVVTNVGNWPVTLALSASTATAGGSPWTLGAAPGIETAVLMGVFNSGAVGPPPATFNTLLNASTTTATGVKYAGNQTAVQIPQGQSRTLWFYFTMPNSSASLGPETIQIVSMPEYP